MENQIKTLLLNHAELLFGASINESLIQFQQARKEIEGDLTLLVFPFVKMMRTSPIAAGEKIGAFLQEHCDEIEKFNVVNGFLNLVFTDSYWISVGNELLAKGNNYFEPNSKPLMMVEFASPNTNKPLHLGHLRNIFLGDAVAGILGAYGHEVIRTQIINDRGIHICKSMLAWERFSPINEKGERETPFNTGLKGDKLVGKYYVEFDKHLKVETSSVLDDWQKGDFSGYNDKTIQRFKELEAAKSGKSEETSAGIDDKIKELAKNATPLMRDAQEMLIKWEARDPQVYLLWTTMNGWVYEGFNATYEKMGVSFDKLYYESDTFLIGKEEVQRGLEEGIFYKKEDGSVWIDLTDEGLDEKLVLRGDGTAVYITQDIGTAIDRYKDFPQLDGIVYTVGNEQDYHFKVLFLILKKLGYHWAENCFHLSYGMVDLPSGKMKSREGTVVDADDLMADVIEKAAEMTAERGHIEGMTEVEKFNLFRQIGLAGLKYYLLKVDPKKRMLFNPEESIDLNGNTGPFIQYSFARIQSLLAKAGTFDLKFQLSILNEEEKSILISLNQYESVLKEAAIECSPSVLINFIYDLAKQFNHFYQKHHILGETNEVIKMNRLVLAYLSAQRIKNVLTIIGVETPNRM